MLLQEMPELAKVGLYAALAGAGCMVLCPPPEGTTSGGHGPSCPVCPANGYCDEDLTCQCWSGYSMCGNDGGGLVCANEKQDDENCGSCGNVCPSAEHCAGGTCACDAVNPDPCALDGGDLACTDLTTDSKNCGHCGQSCPDKQVCTLGVCTCFPSLTIEQCDTDAGLICVDLSKDPDGCGPRPCVGEDAGLTCCDELNAFWDTAVDFARDPFNCGGCGNVCDSGVCLTIDAGLGVCE